jgi:hypothetical protein
MARDSRPKFYVLPELYAIANGFDTPSDKAKEAAAAIVAIEEHVALVAVAEAVKASPMPQDANVALALANLAAVREGSSVLNNRNVNVPRGKI